MDIIFCAGRNKRFAEIALAEDFLYGVRHDYRPLWRPFMVDINWKCYQWSDYVGKVAEWQPVAAMVPDYESPEQRGSMVARACQLVALGVERVMVCPKFLGAVLDVPEWCIIAISVPSSYAGFLPPIAELKGRKVHLLGGSPRDQLDVCRWYRSHGIEVISVDVNMHMKAAQHGTFYRNGKWRYLGAGKVATDDAFRWSCQAIRAQYD
jgi:hypothetical protein